MPRRNRPRYRYLLTISLLAAVAVVAGALASRAANGPRGLTLRWHPCRSEPGFSCATALVPLDYRRPRGQLIQLAVIRHRATDAAHRLGTVFFNPGGPGSSGKQFLVEAFDLFPAAVRARFDIVSWDPRGVAGSAAVQCFASYASEERFLAPVGIAGGTFPVGTSEIRRWISRYRELGRRCAERNGTLLEHVSTMETAIDMELLRRAVGARWMNYFGISYGTLLGATYANLFPGRVRAMVLDGDVDPSAWTSSPTRTRHGVPLSTWLRERSDQGSARTLNAFLDLCGRTAAARCAFSANTAGATRARYRSLLLRLSTKPAPATYSELVSTTVNATYTIEPEVGLPGWRELASTLQRVWGQTTSASIAASSRTSRYSGLEQNLAIHCSESPNPLPSSFATQDALARKRSGAPGRYWTWLAEPCSTWPGHAAERYAGPWNKKTHRTVLLVSTTNDPATPYSDAIAMSRQLARARLLTVDGYGHTSLLNPSACVNAFESRYFISGALPPRGARCRQNRQPF